MARIWRKVISRSDARSNCRRDLRLPLSFLEPGRRYRAEIYRDGEHAHWKTAPFDFVRESREVRSTDVLPLELAAGGGQAIRFVPL